MCRADLWRRQSVDAQPSDIVDRPVHSRCLGRVRRALAPPLSANTAARLYFVVCSA